MKAFDNIENNENGQHEGFPRPQNPHSVPEGYFEGLAGNIMARIRSMEGSAAEEIQNLSPLLAGLSRQMPYAVPEGYFQTLAPDALAVASGEPVMTVLENASRVMPYEVPAKYFEDLSQQVLNRVQPAKVILMVRRRWMRLAVAAALTGLVALGGYFYAIRNSQSVEGNPAVAGQLNGVSNQELDEFIKITDITSTSEQTASNQAPVKTDVKRMLKDVSDNELESFLNQVPTDDEDLFVIN